MSKSAQNLPVAAKPRSKGKPFQKGVDPRRNGNGGRKPNPQSITYWLKEYGNKTPWALADVAAMYAADLKKNGSATSETTMFGLIAVRLLISQVNEPDSRLLDVLLDRTEGKVSQPVEVYDWRKDMQSAGLDPDSLADALFSKVKPVISDAEHSDA